MISVKSALLAASFVVASLQSGTGYKIETRYPVPGNGGFDYLSIDSAARRLYLSHGIEVNVVDADNGKLIGTIADTPGVHGIAIASEFKHGFTSNGRENKVSMFDSVTLQLIKKIDVGKGPDGIYYDPGTKRVFTNNHGSHDISAIDARTGDVIGTVKVDGDGEEAVVTAGLIYVNSENQRPGDCSSAVATNRRWSSWTQLPEKSLIAFRSAEAWTMQVSTARRSWLSSRAAKAS